MPSNSMPRSAAPLSISTAPALLLLYSTLVIIAADDYKLGPDSVPQEGVPAGRVEGPLLFKSQVFTNTLREYWMFVCP